MDNYYFLSEKLKPSTAFAYTEGDTPAIQIVTLMGSVSNVLVVKNRKDILLKISIL